MSANAPRPSDGDLKMLGKTIQPVAAAMNQLVKQASSFEPGTYTFTVRVADAQGTVGGRTFNITISAPAAPTNNHLMN